MNRIRVAGLAVLIAAWASSAAWGAVTAVTTSSAGANSPVNLTSVTVDGQLYNTAALLNTTSLTMYREVANAAHVLTYGGGATPANGSRYTLLTDLALNTGVINPFFDPAVPTDASVTAGNGLGVVFSSPVYNRPGIDVVIFEVDGDVADPFRVRPLQTGIGGVSLLVSTYALSGSIGTAGISTRDLGTVTTLALLESSNGGAQGAAQTTFSWHVYGLDLSNIGYANGASATGLFLRSSDGTNAVDLTLIAGLAVIPEPASLTLLATALVLLRRRRC